MGSVKLPWYRAGDGRTFVDPRSYKRPLFARTDHDTALLEARRLAIELNNGGVEADALTAADRATYAKAKALAGECGRDLLGALSELRDCVQIAESEGLQSLADVLRAGIAVLRRVAHPTSDVVEELLTRKIAAEHDGRYARDVCRHLREFAAAFPGDIRAVEPAPIEAWISARTRPDGQALGPVRRNHVRSQLIMLFKFARERSYISAEAQTAAQSVPKFGSRGEARTRGVEVFTAAEVQFLLSNVEHEWLPYLAIAAFSGLRPEEIGRSYHAARRKDTLRWEDFDWQEREIIVRSEVDKNGYAGRSPILDNLWEWLAPWRDAKATGHVVRGSVDKFRKRLKRHLGKLVANSDEFARLLEWPHDVLRHSYGTYRMATSQRNVHQVAAEMRNSPEMIRKHYDKVGPRSQGKAYFALLPGTAAPNVIQLSLLA